MKKLVFAVIAASNDIYQKFLEDMAVFFTHLCFISARVY